MKKTKQKIIPGMICSVDPDNLNRQDTTGVMHVTVISRIKWRPFGRSLWKCENVNSLSNIKNVTCMEKLMFPANMVLYRFPVDVPVINDSDLLTLDVAIDVLKASPSSQITVNRLKALREKLIFYKGMREV